MCSDTRLLIACVLPKACQWPRPYVIETVQITSSSDDSDYCEDVFKEPREVWNTIELAMDKD